MRKRRSKSGITVNGIAGTYVVVLGLDLSQAKRQGCLGFAIQREDHTEGERYWLRGMKTFRETDPVLGPGGQVSSREHPYQTFQWSDYSAKPDHDYTYRVVPLYGTPQHLEERGELAVRIRTESEWGQKHSVFFNRGAAASQEYARRFLNQPPSKVGEPAYRWLSRGLEEALLAFIGRAADSTFGLYGAIYEFQWPEALQALKRASKAGAKVKILYDAIPGESTGLKNAAAIKAAQIEGLCTARTTGKLMHNKFFVLTRNDEPVAVWTGSTNLTENGIFGHSNVGHVVEDKDVAAAFLAYWRQLCGNPDDDEEKGWVKVNNPAPPAPWHDDVTVVFSPRRGLSVLRWYSQVASGGPLFMTFAFGMNEVFQDVYRRRDGVLRLALMESAGRAAGAAARIQRIRNLDNVIVAIGNNIAANVFDRWLKEITSVTGARSVYYIHTKFMLVDPLGSNPVVITGSANFSPNSTSVNNENMLVIRNDLRVADIYLGEFMRLHSHYGFRESVRWAKDDHVDPLDWQPSYLTSDPSWQEDYFTPATDRFLRRRYFAKT